MLNPSTADGTVDDPTIRRCMRFARDWGFSRLVVRNLFAWRATDPAELSRVSDPIGGRAGDRALQAATRADRIVVAWGAFVPHDRTQRAARLLHDSQAWCLGVTQSGQPRHPLYVPASRQLQPFDLEYSV